MRTPLIVGNWKMNTDLASGTALASAVAVAVGQRADVELAVCPPFPYLAAVRQTLSGSRIGLGAQNCAAEAKGAFTGEVSPGMLKDVGCDWVILGHSERRHLLGETDALVGKKVGLALPLLQVIFCVGETQSERQANETESVIARQLQTGIAGLQPDQLGRLVIAYEPVWAIGTGLNATPEQAEAVHIFIRQWVARKFSAAAAEKLRIQYGGSVNPGNAAGLLGQPNVDGFLVGGASLKSDDFAKLIDLGAEATRRKASG